LLNPRVLDTTVVSQLLDESPLVALYQPYLENATLCISFQTIAELRFGALKARWGQARRQRLDQFLTGFYLIVYTDELARHWAHVMYDARRVGRRLEAADAWIAATARHLNAPLLTHDRDFSPEACPSITILCRA
jgi:predicted nucleic acid-binding protein